MLVSLEFFTHSEITMTHSIGLCGLNENRHLPPQKGLPAYFPQPPFWADVTPTMYQKAARIIPERLYLGLLTKAPDADGVGAVECAAEGYRRQPFEWVHLNAMFETNSSPLCVKVSQAVDPVRYVGLFDEADTLRFYGRILYARQSTTATSVFEFPEYKVRLRSS